MAGITEYSNPVQNSLEQYVPIPLDMLFKAGQAIQQRGDIQQAQNDQIETGLASTEALAPAHRDFVNKYVNDYRTQQRALLDKYHLNTSDPTYEQEARRLNMQFAADPRLQIIKQANDLYKKKQSIKDELDAKGIKYIDSNPNFTGVDENGNLISNVGGYHATEFDKNIDTSFRNKENAIEQVGQSLTNRRNLNKVLATYMDKDGTLNTNNQDVQQGLSYWKQQGLSDQDAAAKVKNTVLQGLGYAHDLKDHFYEMSPYQKEELSLRWAELNQKKKEGQGEGVPNLLPFSSEKSPLVESHVRDNKLAALDHLSFNDAGGIKKNQFFMDDTPENRQVLKQKGQKFSEFNDIDPDAYGTDSYVKKKLQVEGGYNPDESKLIDEARDMLGDQAKNNKGQYLSDKHIIERYKDALSKQSMSYNFIKPNNKDYLEAMENVQIGKKGENIGPTFTVLNSDGTVDDGSKKGSNPLENIKEGSYSIGGINPTPFGKYQYGTIKINATDKKGNPLEILKPLDKYQQQSMYIPNQLYQALNSDKSNEELEKNPITAPNGQKIIVQKGISNGTLGMKVYLGHISKETEIDVDGLINSQMAGFYDTQRPYEKLK